MGVVVFLGIAGVAVALFVADDAFWRQGRSELSAGCRRVAVARLAECGPEPSAAGVRKAPEDQSCT